MADKFVKVDNTSTDPVPNIQLGSELGGVTKIKSQNSTFNRTLTLPDKDGVLATLADAQGSSTALLSAGCTVVPVFTNNGDDTFTVGPGSANIFDNADGAGGLANYNVTGGTFTPTDLTDNYLVYNYNGGSPIPQLIQSVATINETTIVPVYTVFRQGNSLTWLNWDQLGYALGNKLHQSIVKTERFRRQTGLALAEVPTRIVSVSAGIVWIGAIPVDLPSFVSSTNTMIQATRTAGNWVYTTVTQYNNTQYDDGTNTIALSGSTYAVNFIYRIVQEGVSRVVFVLGNSNATLDQAIEMQPPSTLPPGVFSAGMLVGRIIVARAASTATRIDSAFNQFWGSGGGGSGTGVTDHNSLNGIQGGAPGEYYHLTSAKYTFANGMDQQVSTTANPTFNTTLVSNGGAGKTTITRAASASSYTFTLPAASGTAALTSDLAGYALKAGDTIGGIVLGDKAQHGSLAYDAATGLTVRAKTGSTNDLTVYAPNGTTVLLAAATGGTNITSGMHWAFTNNTGSTSISTGCATFVGGVGVGENIFVGGYVHANNVKVTGGGVGSTTITRASSSDSYTATLPAKDGTIAMLSDISGGGGGGAPTVDVITASGNWVCPAGVTRVKAFVVGGGGGGGGTWANAQSAGGGGGGAIAIAYLTVVPGTSYAITIGSGGAGGTSSGNGSNGGTSSFSTLLTARGGGGGGAGNQRGGAYGYPDRANTTTASAPYFGCGGSGASGAGQEGGPANQKGGAVGTGAYGGSGGGGSWGPGAQGGPSGGTTPGFSAANNTGGGGGGAGGSTGFSDGGAGGSGVVVLEYWT